MNQLSDIDIQSKGDNRISPVSTNEPAFILKPRVLEDIAERYSVGFAFSDRLLSIYMEAQGLNFTVANTYDELLTLCSPTHKMHLEFALTTNIRGVEVLRLLQQLITLKQRRYLDIGCGYAGFLIAFAQAGFETKGIEIAPHLAELSRLNCKDFGLNNNVLNEDFLTTDLAQLGRFDVITCNDVIEHVNNPDLAIKRISALLNPNGLLFMEIPNKDYIGFVESDGHFNLFGINQLDRSAAGQFYKDMTGLDGYNVGMGEFYSFAYYTSRLEVANFSCQVIKNRHKAGNLDSVPQMLASLSQAFERWFTEDRPRCEPIVAEKLIQNYSAYMSQLHLDYNKARFEGEVEAFNSRYLSSFWSIVATKNPHGQAEAL